MEIIKKNMASIKQNAMSDKRVNLSIAKYATKNQELQINKTVFSIVTDSEEVIGIFKNLESAEGAIYELYGCSSDWDLRYDGVQKYTNKYGKECYRGVTPDTPFSDLEFHKPEFQFENDVQMALHTNLGTITVLSRMTGFGYVYIETGYRSPDDKFWLAAGDFDVRDHHPGTIQDAIEMIKASANLCFGD